MHSLLLLLAFAAAPVGARPSEALDLRCYRLMAELAEHEDARIRQMGMTAAHYFLGRIDAHSPGADLDAAGGEEPREPLLRACGEAMGAAGRDFRRMGEALAPNRRPSV